MKKNKKKKSISDELIEKLYNTEENLVLENGEKFDIPVLGSLGLLATGHRGLVAWRNKRKEQGVSRYSQAITEENKNE